MISLVPREKKLPYGLREYPLIFTLFLLVALVPAFSYADDGVNETAYDNKSATILVYQRMAEDESPDTSIRLEQFIAQIEELREGSYNIIALPALVSALKNGKTLPPRTVVITFDGGYSSAIRHAVPVLNKHNIPFTVFFPVNNVNASDRYLSMQDIKHLKKNKLATLGLHPAGYIRLSEEPESEIRREINSAKAAFRDMTGQEAAFFAYPFGEYSAAYRNIIEQSGFKAAVSQHSSVAYSGYDIFSLPRFAMTEKYADIERFRLITNAYPLPVSDVSPSDPSLNTNNPVIGFSVDTELSGFLDVMSCFISGQDRPQIEVVGQNRIELRPKKPLTDARTRINCTMPGPQNEPGEPLHWRWFGLLMTLPEMAALDNEYVNIRK